MCFKSLSVFVLILAASSSLPAHSAVRKVPQQYPSIQAAVDAAVDGDTVRVAQGTYPENVTIAGKAISLIGAGAATTIIDGGGHDRGIAVLNVQPGTATIAGFTIRNGSAPGTEGGGLYAVDSNTIVRDNVLTANTACFGMALSAVGGSLKLLRNWIVANAPVDDCGYEAVLLRMETESVIEQNVIANHQSSGVYIQTAAKIYFRRNVVRDNAENLVTAARGWGGLGSYSSELVLENNLFVNNSGSLVGALFLGAADNGTQITRGNSFTSNTGSISSAVMFSGAPHDTNTNLFSDSQNVPEIDCGGNPLTIARSNVFASDSNPSFSGPCSFEP